MLGYVVLHDFVVSMGIYADVGIMGETVFHDTAEYSVSIGITGYTMNNMIWFFIIKPLSFIDPGISGFWRF